jgi:hypothetical protein
MAGKGALVVLVEASCAVTVCDASGGLLKLLANAGDSDGSARDVDADVSNGTEGGNFIDEGGVAMGSNLVATPSEMRN